HHRLSAKLSQIALALPSAAICTSGGPAAANTPPTYPGTGLVLLSLQDGSPRGAAHVGSDPVAVIVSDDGRTAYVADSSPGDVYAVGLPGMRMAWKSHVGGAPFGLLLQQDRLFVSLFDGAAVDELDPASGRRLASHPVAQGPAAITVDTSGKVAVAGTRGVVDYLD